MGVLTETMTRLRDDLAFDYPLRVAGQLSVIARVPWDSVGERGK